MIKDCPVLKTNELVSVIDFDGTKIQIPSIYTEGNKKSARVLFENGCYTVVSDDYIPTQRKKKKKQQ